MLADWKAAETTKRLVAKATEVEKQLKDGVPLDAIAGEFSLEKQTKRGLKRDADDADLGRDGVAAIFAVARNGTGHPSPTGDGQVLFKVTEMFEPAGAGPEPCRKRRGNASPPPSPTTARSIRRRAAGAIRRDGQPGRDRTGAELLMQR